MSSANAPFLAGPPLPAEIFETIRRRALIEGCKWDAQVGDITALAQFPLLFRPETWQRLAAWAEALSTETFAAEEEILRKPELLRQLGFPKSLQRALSGAGPLTPAAVRTIRFDFHLTTDGWRISEANSDVPGGYTEASHFTALVAAHYPAYRPAGNPGDAWAEAFVRKVSAGTVALLSAPALMEDLQVVSFLARQLTARGIPTQLVTPGQILWRNGHAFLSGHDAPIAAVVRFFQGEWLVDWPGTQSWQLFFRNGITPVAHPGQAMITESKRFPLVWDALTTPLPAWRELLPESRDPRDAPWVDDDEWLIKQAFSNTGDSVAFRSAVNADRWSEIRKMVQRNPDAWVAQRRFNTLPLTTPLGEMFPCIGVYTINGRAAGIYARLSSQQIVDFKAIDIAALIYDEAPCD